MMTDETFDSEPARKEASTYTLPDQFYNGVVLHLRVCPGRMLARAAGGSRDSGWLHPG